jgi:N-acetyl-gamma-glutamyl-phosphate reductase
MIRCAIVGAAGYTGVELIKILLHHPLFEIAYLGGSEEARLEELYPAFKGVYEANIEKLDIKKIVNSCEVAFLALPHKTSMEVAKPLIEAGIKVIDLSADYRLNLENYEAFYTLHTDKEHLKKAVYGLPEIFRDDIRESSLVANPGCYPTATLLALIPFLKFIDSSYPIMIDAKSGVSGAGKKCKESTHFVAIDENIFAYNPIKHRHSIEIKEKIELLSKEVFEVNFVPQLIPVNRGMLVNVYALLKEDIELKEVLESFYKEEPFVRIKDRAVDIKSVAGTHFCDIFAMKNKKTLFVSSAIDNLLRGASSQAVVNANIVMGLDETLGVPKVAYIP